jgi:hypothetical protein
MDNFNDGGRDQGLRNVGSIQEVEMAKKWFLL